ncbi:hypothetical protein ACIBEH_05300 [Nocardia salmonicida]|uniref:hypothetical protein n=1 Tax=Nocardia salmonicida TaxID=53431 RepID=UPI0037A360AC
MVEWSSTREQRQARLQGLVDGSAKAGRGTRTAPENLLMGVGLRAVARREQGLELSELEQLLTDALDKLLPRDEIAQAGALFTRAQEQGTLAGVASSVAQLPVTAPYSTADLVAELPVLGKQVMAQPNCNVVKVADLTAGGSLDSPEFVEAIRGYDSVLTVVSGDGSQARTLPETTLNFRMLKFYCQERTGDSSFGKSDEIYWMTGGGSDLGAETTYASQEFGDVDSGEQRPFPANASLLRGRVGEIVTVDIECWEKDSGSFWEEIRDALRDVANACVDACGEIAEHGESADAGLAALVAVIAGLMGAILTWLLGKDDLIQQRTFAFDRAALEALREDNTWLDFRGEDAWYQLIVQVIGARPIARHWKGLAGTTFENGDFDAAVTVPDSENDIYIFSADKYVRYHVWDEKLVAHTAIAEGWPALAGTTFAAGLDAAANVPGSGSDVYLFQGADYMRYDAKAEKIIRHKSLAAGWPGLAGTPFATGGFDAAVAVPGSPDDVYLFKGSQYMRYNTTADEIVQHKSLVAGWPGLADTPFAEGGVDAAAVVPDSSSDVYLFKGTEYVRYNVEQDGIVYA